MKKCDIGLIGLAVMGQNLVLNMNDHGFKVAVYNRTVSKVDDFINGNAKGTEIVGTHSIEELVSVLKKPRRVMLLVKAGKPVDDFIELLIPHLERGDIIIDGGNSNYNDTIRRTAYVESKGLLPLVAQGHVLLEGAPGLGKTLLAKSLARLLGGEFGRIQGTADLMPSDMTGINVYDNEKHHFEFLPGPLFNKVVLVDEINRTGPKTQSALLQAMEENKITLDRKTYALPEDFFIIASQNPLDFEGVYPLLESQLDRFLVRLDMSYPDLDTEIAVLSRYDRPGGGHTEALDVITALPAGLVQSAREEAASVHVADSLYHYVATIAAASRNHPRLALGLSPRGALAMMRCARVEAAIQGREFVTPDDIKMVAPLVACHRLLPTSEAMLEGIDALQIYRDIEAQVVVPRDLGAD